jgi:hypothetical protein
MAQPPTIDIHPGGDVILICGNGGDKIKYGAELRRFYDCKTESDMRRRLRVSSVFLVHTSPVFKALLGPHFKEGNVLAASSSVEIPTPDDDSAAMELISLVLHHKDIPSEIDADSLCTVATCCDKYAVLIAMKPAINLWLDACLKTSMTDVTAIELLNLAFKFKAVDICRQTWNYHGARSRL